MSDEVVLVLRRIGGGDNADGEVRDGPRPAPTEERTLAVDTVPEPGTTATAATLAPGHWTQELAADFTAGLDIVARRVMFQVWRAGAAGIRRNTLWPDVTDLTPVELRSLLMRMGHALRRFRRERGMALSRPVVANSPLQSYFIDRRIRRGGVRSVRGEDAGPAVQWLAAPLTNACHTAPGRTNRASVVEHAAADCRPVDRVGLRRWTTPTTVPLRRYAKCMTDTNTTLYRMTVSSASGTVTLSAEAMEKRLRGQLERGECTMGEIRSDYARYRK